MANSESITINSDNTSGMTGAVGADARKREKLFFSIRETGDSASFSATVTLQFKAGISEEWQDYDTYTSVTYKVIETVAGMYWRAGVKDSGDFEDGEVTVGFNW